MVTVRVRDVYDYINSIAPFEEAESWDNCGLLVGEMSQPVSGILVALDLNRAVLSQAIAEGVNLIVCHHPVIFKPLKSLEFSSVCGQLAKYGISVICAHTNLDVAGCGVNFCLGQALGLVNTKPLRQDIERPWFVVSVFVPPGDSKRVAAAMSEFGAGRIGNYAGCSFEASGVGSFMPTEGANPYLGEVGDYTKAAEVRLEMACQEKDLKAILAAMKAVHPYEEPVFSVVRNYGRSEHALCGLVGELPQELEATQVLQKVSNSLGAEVLRYYLPSDKKVKTVACCGGAGAFMLKDAKAAGADLFITGDVKHSVWYEAENYGIGLVDAEHFFTENLVVAELELRLGREFKGITCKEAANNTPLYGCWVNAGWSEE